MNRIVNGRWVAVSATVATVVFLGVPAEAQRSGHSSHGSASRGASAQHSPPARPAGSFTYSSSSSRSTAPAPTAMAAQRSRPIGAPATGVAVPRAPIAGVDGRRVIFSRPYYAFRPRYSLGIGLFVGYPVAFPYWYTGYYYNPYYYDPYYYNPYYYNPYATYGYYAAPGYSSAYGSTSGSAYGSAYGRSGGLSFDITPADAAVFIDGKYVGSIEDFSSTELPLTLAAGRHHVDLRAQGYQTMSFDITVIAGQVIPYQGVMTPIR